MKVWFISPEYSPDFRKLLLINNLIIKSFVDVKIIKKDEIEQKYNFKPIKDNQGKIFYFPIQHLTFMTLRKKDDNGNFLCSKNAFETFEKITFP